METTVHWKDIDRDREVFVSGIISWYLFNTIIIFYRVKEYYFEIRYCNEWSISLFFGYTLYKFRREISIAEHGCYKFNFYPKEEEG